MKNQLSALFIFFLFQYRALYCVVSLIFKLNIECFITIIRVGQSEFNWNLYQRMEITLDSIYNRIGESVKLSVQFILVNQMGYAPNVNRCKRAKSDKIISYHTL